MKSHSWWSVGWKGWIIEAFPNSTVAPIVWELICSFIPNIEICNIDRGYEVQYIKWPSADQLASVISCILHQYIQFHAVGNYVDNRHYWFEIREALIYFHCFCVVYCACMEYFGQEVVFVWRHIIIFMQIILIAGVNCKMLRRVRIYSQSKDNVFW